MPTGYTSDVVDGKVTTFPDFAWQCARAFGALVNMRDEPSNAAIPQSFEPSPFYLEQLHLARNTLARLQRMTHEDIHQAAAKAREEQIKSRVDYKAEKILTAARYDAMIKKVEAWGPPSPDHEEMKRFMLQQLRDGKDFDCGHFRETPLPPFDPEKWWTEELDQARQSVERYAVEWEKEQSRVQGRNEWLRKLRESLSKYQEP